MIMRYFLCFLCPPIAILTTGKLGAMLLNIILTIFLWVPGIIHAILVVNKYYDDKRHRQFMNVARRGY
jgi:uncharacterized membrane protein YqaE (UPF0057 family)